MLPSSPVFYGNHLPKHLIILHPVQKNDIASMYTTMAATSATRLGLSVYNKIETFNLYSIYLRKLGGELFHRIHLLFLRLGGNCCDCLSDWGRGRESEGGYR